MLIVFFKLFLVPFLTVDTFKIIYKSVNYLPYQPSMFIGGLFKNTTILNFEELSEYCNYITQQEYVHPFKLNKKPKSTTILTPREYSIFIILLAPIERPDLSQVTTEFSYALRCLYNLKTLFVGVCRLTGNTKIDKILLETDPDASKELVFSSIIYYNKIGISATEKEFHVLLGTLLFYRKITELSVYRIIFIIN